MASVSSHRGQCLLRLLSALAKLKRRGVDNEWVGLEKYGGTYTTPRAFKDFGFGWRCSRACIGRTVHGRNRVPLPVKEPLQTFLSVRLGLTSGPMHHTLHADMIFENTHAACLSECSPSRAFSSPTASRTY
ncbi:hypothetical protein P691DRAFT_800380 [Macrolepiota fuliginosa MF-IS2]|uniref:Uncharacterized protein n=1 Tax=Macrolepiota fuliginosa MF-IS2 TaxID=1400762 RepID=A0A9P5X020_9AGAR|nr:hypothetical protein P691DRAFT_801456 [Macrolepiota fuliginosa MF-IS2]KAF9441074.1 hypothetical protein P691DRAFT_800380 [Macrolepiota fuliginosa MF-IS2]